MRCGNRETSAILRDGAEVETKLLSRTQLRIYSILSLRMYYRRAALRENLKHGSVRGIKQISMWSLSEVEMVEYCDTPHIEREEKQGIQSIPKEVGYGVYSTACRNVVIGAPSKLIRSYQ